MSVDQAIVIDDGSGFCKAGFAVINVYSKKLQYKKINIIVIQESDSV